jgi:xylulokinase
MGLDVGTTGCKASVFDESGAPESSAYREYPLICPRPAWAELDPERVWLDIRASIRECIERSGQDREIKALSISAQGEAFLPVSEDGRPLYNSIVTPDQRAQDQTKLLEETFGREDLFRMTGMVLFPIYTLNKILWLRDHEPGVFSRTHRFLCWEDYVNLKLTGSPIIDHSLANRTLMFDINRRQWSDEILGELDLDQSLLAEPAQAGEPVGEVTERGSRETGLSRGTLVVAGGHDQACGCLGAGVVEEGPLYDVTGTVECLMPALSKPLLTGEMMKSGYGNYCHVAPDRYLILGYNMTAGTILRWFRDNFAREEMERAEALGKPAYSLLDEMASSVPPGSEGLVLLPYFMGAATPNWDTHARGTLTGLTLAHGKAHIIRAIMEGITFELRANLEALRSAGIGTEQVRAVGGGARSPFWCQMKADVTQLPVVVPQVSEASSLGAALLAGIGSGVYGSVDEAVERTYSVRAEYHPARHDGYEKAFGLYRDLYERIAPLFPSLTDA